MIRIQDDVISDLCFEFDETALIARYSALGGSSSRYAEDVMLRAASVVQQEWEDSIPDQLNDYLQGWGDCGDDLPLGGAFMLTSYDWVIESVSRDVKQWWFEYARGFYKECRQLIRSGGASGQDEKRIDELNREIASILVEEPHLFGRELRMDPHRFEELIASVFKNQGFQVKLGPIGPDQGVDIWVSVEGDQEFLGIVQCKRSRRTIGVETVRNVYGTMKMRGASRAAIVTNTEFSPSAVKEAAPFVHDLHLLDGVALTEWLRQFAERSS